VAVNKVYIVSMTLDRILSMPDGPRKTAALASWVQQLFEGGQEPILVGGAAVELYTDGAYTTGDLDMIGTVSAKVSAALVENGFRRAGRHWVYEKGQVFLEFPGAALQEGETATRLKVGRYEVVTISPEDLIAERLAAWQYWRSAVDGANAWLLYRARSQSWDRRRARGRALAHGAENAWRALLAFARKAGHREPTSDEVALWANRGP